MKTIWTNFKTTLAGAFTGLPLFFTGVENGNVQSILLGLGTFLIGLFAKDHNH